MHTISRIMSYLLHLKVSQNLVFFSDTSMQGHMADHYNSIITNLVHGDEIYMYL